jgi:hypothetical protein
LEGNIGYRQGEHSDLHCLGCRTIAVDGKAPDCRHRARCLRKPSSMSSRVAVRSSHRNMR